MYFYISFKKLLNIKMKSCFICDVQEEKKNEIQLNKKVKENFNYYCRNFELEKIGFYNIGNSCYMNSFLQILLHIPNFLEYLKKDYKNSNKESILIQNIINLANFPNNKNYLYLIQEYMSNISSNYNRYKQADSQNFGIDLINEIITNIKGEEELYSEYNNNINEEMNNIINYKKIKYNEFIKKYQKENELIFLEHMFLVNEINNYFYPNGTFKLKFDCYLNIELSFQKDKQNEYLDKYLLKDLLDFKYNKKLETNHKNKNCYLKLNYKSSICKLPKILIITISRSEIGKELKTKKLVIPNEIDFLQYTDDVLIKKKNCKYKLFCINEKLGKSKSFGHYYCFIKIEKKWYLFDDEKVIEKKPNLISRNVVGLFYEEYK